MIPFLAAERAGRETDVPIPARCAMVQFYHDTPSDFREVWIEVGTGKITHEKLLKGKHSYVDSTEMQAAEESCLASNEVQEAICMLQLPEAAVVCVEPWTYGTDGMNDMAERVIMVSVSEIAQYISSPLQSCEQGLGRS